MIFIDEIISQKAMELVVCYNLSYNLLLTDAIIVTTCLTKGLKLFTFNKKDFAYIKEIKFYTFPDTVKYTQQKMKIRNP